MSERMNGTREREPKKDFYDVYKLDELLMTNNIEAMRELLATNWTLLNKYSKSIYSNLYYNLYLTFNIDYGDIHHYAIYSDTDNTDMTKLLLSHGAPVNRRGLDSFTPLHHVCWKGKVKLCELFHTNGARYDLKTNNNNTPLCFATNVDIVKVLIR